MNELLTLFGVPTICTLIPMTLRLAWITSAMGMKPGVSFWVRSASVIGVLTPDAFISFLASATFGKGERARPRALIQGAMAACDAIIGRSGERARPRALIQGAMAACDAIIG